MTTVFLVNGKGTVVHIADTPLARQPSWCRQFYMSDKVRESTPEDHAKPICGACKRSFRARSQKKGS